MTPRIQLKIGNWTVRTMYSAGRSAQAARAMNQMKIQIMGKANADELSIMLPAPVQEEQHFTQEEMTINTFKALR